MIGQDSLLDIVEKAAVTETPAPLHCWQFGQAGYEKIWQAMRQFTLSRTARTADEIWLGEHPPVFTQGLAGKAEHLLQDVGIPIIRTDRGGQITYHGPGQIMAYVLLDLGRRKIKVRDLVHGLEQAIINVLAANSITAQRREKAPGVYVGEAKIASLGLRIRNGCSYHGLALNCGVNLTPFQYIDPCGYKGLHMTRLSDLCPGITQSEVEVNLLQQLKTQLS